MKNMFNLNNLFVVLVLAISLDIVLSEEDFKTSNLHISYPRNFVEHENEHKTYESNINYDGGMTCHDNGIYCKNINCTDKEAALTIGMTCNKFPVYNGGYPLSNIEWVKTEVVYNCFIDNGNYCVMWKSIEQGYTSGNNDYIYDYKLGIYNCTVEGENECNVWDSYIIEAKYCEESYRFKVDGSYVLCEKNFISNNLIYAPEQRLFSGKTECINITKDIETNITYCNEWTEQLISSDENTYDRNKKSICTEFNGIYCNKWNTITTSKVMFEVEECIRYDINNIVCNKKFTNMFIPNQLFVLASLCLLIVIFGFIGIFIGMLLEIYGKFSKNVKKLEQTLDRLFSNVYFAVFCVVMANVFNIVFVWLGGILLFIIFNSILSCFGLICLLLWSQNSSDCYDDDKYIENENNEYDENIDEDIDNISLPPGYIYPPKYEESTIFPEEGDKSNESIV